MRIVQWNIFGEAVEVEAPCPPPPEKEKKVEPKGCRL